LHIWAHNNNGTTHVVDLLFGGIAVEVEYPLPQAPMRVDTKKIFTEHDEEHNVKDGIGHELMKLHAIDKEKPTKEFVGRQQ
jgi:hypothetical protein